jgi:DNA-directed RNA polymerase specialized sigma24 family protein
MVMTMADDEVTLWLSQLAQGDQKAAERIWRRYFEKLVHLARSKLEGLPRRAADEEDVALSAMHSFCRAVAAGRYPRLQDRDDLWKLLVAITSHKAIALCRRERAEKRGGGHVRGGSIVGGSGEADERPGVDAALGREPTPQLAAIMAETCEALLARLEDGSLQKLALLKLQGYSNGEIAAQFGLTERSVERKLGRIRKIWGDSSPGLAPSAK